MKYSEKELARHYEECADGLRRGLPCRCEGIDRSEENYRTEPDDMFAREWGS
ncbi:hypothetical protein [Streptomyces sp. DW26H14]|uniref:hypothetical protein n=1 Tax=Streptomyces sp. DW26H14 TaxID=3435395 RepID=UPI00403D8602